MLNNKYNITFNQVFKSILTDNGAPFLDYKKLEKSFYKYEQEPRTIIYFCHPYCSYEKGLIERNNGSIRRFYPKKTNFRYISKKNIGITQEILNDNPCPTLKITPNEIFKANVEKEFGISNFNINLYLNEEEICEAISLPKLK